MITRFANLTSRLALVFAIMFTFAACGGGGGGGGGGAGFTGEGGGDDLDTYYLAIALLDSLGNPTNTITSTSSATVEVTVRINGKNGKPVPDEIVSATADLGTVQPENGQALTNSDGIATLQISADGVLGAGNINVSVQSPAGAVTESLTFQVNFADLQLGYYEGSAFIPGEIGISADTLPSSGSALLTVNVVNESGDPVNTVEVINFTGHCVRSRW